ncbi:MAG: class I SAM-dependent methyltransferase [Kiritimatiellaeota bacterium]|nr:class I SAM-dependent methyltransferase [Kiritimatiellota bacterium]
MNTTPNRFDLQAAEWDNNPGRLATANNVAAAMVAAVPVERSWRALDCGAGTGLLTLNLLPHVAEICATDSSAGMLEQLQKKLAAAHIENVSTLLWDADAESCPRGGFDLVCSSMVLHHLLNIPAALQRIVQATRVGGWLAVADLETEDGSFHPDPAGVHHHGFAPADIARWLADAGCRDIATRTAYTIIKPDPTGHEHSYPIFLATARRD